MWFIGFVRFPGLTGCIECFRLHRFHRIHRPYWVCLRHREGPDYLFRVNQERHLAIPRLFLSLEALTLNPKP